MVKTGASMLAFVAATAGPAMVASFALSPGAMAARGGAVKNLRMSAEESKRVPVIGGTRSSGPYPTRELHTRGHKSLLPAAAADASGEVEMDVEKIESSAQGFYDHSNALNFHKQVWGGDIHIGLYDHLDTDQLELGTRDRMKLATTMSTDMLLRKAFANRPSPVGSTVVDMGSGFGSTARAAVRQYDCNMVCIDIAGGFNAANNDMTAAAGLSDKVTIPGERSFFDTQLPSGSVDTIVSQDSFSHASTEHHRVFQEAARILKPGGVLCFTDNMQQDNADTIKLAEVFRLLDIACLGSPGSFEELGAKFGFELLEFDNRFSANQGAHYQHLVDVTSSLKSGVDIKDVDDAWISQMTFRYSTWLAATKNDVVTWGLFVFRKKGD